MQYVRTMLSDGGFLLPQEVQLGLIVIQNGKEIVRKLRLWDSTRSATEEKVSDEQERPMIELKIPAIPSFAGRANVFITTEVRIFGKNSLVMGDSKITEPIFAGKIEGSSEEKSLYVAYQAGVDLIYGTEPPVCESM